MKRDRQRLPIVELSTKQLSALKKLWFVYGNHGKKETLFNHKYIQGFLEDGHDRKEPYIEGRKTLAEKGKSKAAITDECIAAVEKIVYP